VLGVWRRVEKLEWSVDDDNALLDMYCLKLGDLEIANIEVLEGRSTEEIRTRRVELMYGEEMAMHDGSKLVEKTGLEKALGKPKYDWMISN
jgi:hypothetical protein